MKQWFICRMDQPTHGPFNGLALARRLAGYPVYKHGPEHYRSIRILAGGRITYVWIMTKEALQADGWELPVR